MGSASLGRTIRIALAVLGVVALAAAMILLSAGGEIAGAGLWVSVLGGVLLTAAGFEFLRQQALVREAVLREREAMGPKRARSVPTDETVEDPKTGRRLRVWVDPATGKHELRPQP